MNESKGKWLSWPNLITAVRILGSPALIVLALMEITYGLVGLAVLLVFTEWLDGFLARLLRATSAVGARLDTIADAVFYSSLLIAILLLRPGLILQEKFWIFAAIASYLLSWLASWAKFQRLPSYHTWAAKAVWIAVGAGTICLLTDNGAWPFRAAMICVALTNLEAVCITLKLPESRVDVPSFWHVLGPNGFRTTT